MKTLRSFLAVCAAVCGLSAMAQAIDTFCPNYSPQTVVLKGTMTDDFNFHTIPTATTNCFAWVNDPRKLDVFLVLCYDGVVCTDCPIILHGSADNPTGAYAYVVDKKAKTVRYGEVSPGHIRMVCMGENNVGLWLHLGDEHPSLPFQTVAAGKRDCKYGLLSFRGHYADFEMNRYYNPVPCEVANLVRAGDLTLRRDDSMTKKALGATDKWCPECIASGCDGAMALLDAYIHKTFKVEKGYDYYPWDVI